MIRTGIVISAVIGTDVVIGALTGTRAVIGAAVGIDMSVLGHVLVLLVLARLQEQVQVQ